MYRLENTAQRWAEAYQENFYLRLLQSDFNAQPVKSYIWTKNEDHFTYYRKMGISRVAFCPVLGVTMPLEIPLLR